MCYPVIVIGRLCLNDHITDITGCWRQCRRQAEHAAATRKWDRLCANRVQPRYMEEMCQIAYRKRHDDQEGGQDGPDGDPCETCLRIEADSRHQVLKNGISSLRETRSNTRDNLEELGRRFDDAWATLTGPELNAELKDIRERTAANEHTLRLCDKPLKKLKEERNQIKEFYDEEHDARCLQRAFETFNHRFKLFYGRPDRNEKLLRADYPRHLCELDVEIYRFEILVR